MSKISRRSAILATSAAGLLAQSTPPRKSRADSFFGIHFDLHPKGDDTELGKNITTENVVEFLKSVRPDYVQYDCKGHVGWLGYPSKVSKSSPGIVQDSLAIWRKLTAAEGVALYIHFSGVWDGLAITEHPEWARIKPDGTADDRQTSLFSKYAEERMIPQLLEVSAKYNLDGAWIDGECWQTNPDYSPAAIAAWRRLGLGFDAPPKTAKDPHWDVWLEFQRQRFRDYVRNYVTRLHQERPGFQVASNWLYTTFVPEKPDLPVDFLSGDYLGNASLTRARLDSRYLHQTGKPWDLMAWGFQVSTTQPIGHIHKPAIQLQQEASVVLAQGGGFQIYYQPTRAGFIDPRNIKTMSKVAKFCRDRQALCHKSESLSDTAMWFSKTSLYRTTNKLFGGWGKAIGVPSGMLDAIVHTHRSVDVLPDWAPIPSSQTLKTLVVPDWEDIGDSSASAILAKVREGLNVLLVGAQNAKRFAPLLGYRLPSPAVQTAAFLAGPTEFGIVSGLWQAVDAPQAKVLFDRYPTFDATRDGVPAALLFELGKGKVVVAPGPLGELYEATHTPALRHAIDACLNALAPAQTRLADRTAPVELVLRRQGASTVLHLLNHVNQQVAANFPAVEVIPALPPQQVSVRLAAAPKRVVWEPSGRNLTFTYRDGVLTFETPAIELHHMAVIS